MSIDYARSPVPSPAGGGEAAAAAEQTEFDVVLESAGDKKIQVIKVVREATGLGLKEAKDLVDGAPKAVKEKVSKADADALRAKREESGAKVVIKWTPLKSPDWSTRTRGPPLARRAFLIPSEGGTTAKALPNPPATATISKIFRFFS